MIRIPCPGCDKTLRMPDSLTGRTVACPQCKTKFRVPPLGATQDADEQAEAAPSKTPTARKPGKMRPPVEAESQRPVKRSQKLLEEEELEELDNLEEIEEPAKKKLRGRRADDEADREEQHHRPSRKRKKKLRAKGANRWVEWWAGLSPFGKFIGGAVAACVVLALLSVFFPPLALIPMVLAVAMVLIGQWMLIVAAFQDSAAVGLAYLIVPLFPLYFIITPL